MCSVFSVCNIVGESVHRCFRLIFWRIKIAVHIFKGKIAFPLPVLEFRYATLLFPSKIFFTSLEDWPPATCTHNSLCSLQGIHIHIKKDGHPPRAVHLLNLTSEFGHYISPYILEKALMCYLLSSCSHLIVTIKGFWGHWNTEKWVKK